MKKKMFFFILLLVLSIYLFLYILQYNNEFLKYDVIIINVFDSNTVLSDITNHSVNNEIINHNFFYKFLNLFHRNSNTYFPSYFVRSDNKFSSHSIIFNDIRIEHRNSAILLMLENRSFLIEKYKKEYISVLENIVSMLE